ncbi:MAG: mucoidy inhibitor MuiA family protein [Anderseniella sp.]|nr:mucoidy inhibitor MuiA family protein [Anderseniella sp.]
MKRTLLLAALASMALASPGLAAEIPATLKIEEVTVNPRGAQLVRIGEVELPAGSHEIIIDTLPANIDASSVQVQGRSTVSTEIGAVDVSLKVVDPAAESATQRKQLEAEIEALGRDRERQQQALSDAEFRRNTLERLTGGFGAVPYATGDKPAMGPKQIRALLALTSEELEATSQALLNARTALDKIDERINLLQRKLQELASAPSSRTRVAIQVNAAEAATMSLSLSYTVPDAGWRPVYDARLSLPKDAGGKAKLELVSRAMVFQRSGEAWDDVSLKLSTAQVSGRTSAPVLEPVAAGPRPAMVAKESAADEVRAPASPGISNFATQRAAPVISRLQKARQREAEVVNAGFHAVYTIAGRTSVPNTGAQKSVRIGTSDAAPAIRIDTVPMLDPQGYLTAVFKAQGETPMLPGEVSLFRDGVFAGKSRIAQVSPGEEVELGFGRDDLVRISRRQVDDTAGSSGIISSQTTLSRAYRTTIENLHAFPVSVRMSERMPYSTHEDVKVDMARDTTKPARTNPDNKRGIVEWDVPLEGGKKAEIRFGYTVSYPAEMSVVLPGG